jgi:hypothetical protein
MLLYLYLITLCKMHVHCEIIFTKLQAQFNSLSLNFIGNTKTRISNIVVVYIDAVFSFSFIYIFSKFSYKKNIHLQMRIRIGNGTVVNNRLSYWFYLYYVYLLHRMIVFKKCTCSIRMLKDIRFSAITAVTWPSNFLWILYHYFAWLNKTKPATFHNFAV